MEVEEHKSLSSKPHKEAYDNQDCHLINLTDHRIILQETTINIV